MHYKYYIYFFFIFLTLFLTFNYINLEQFSQYDFFSSNHKDDESLYILSENTIHNLLNQN